MNTHTSTTGTTQEKPKKLTHRLFCEGCTNIAMYYAKGDEYPDSVTCEQCGKADKFRKENLIAL